MDKGQTGSEIAKLLNIDQGSIDAYIKEFQNPNTKPIAGSIEMSAATKEKHATYLLQPLTSSLELNAVEQIDGINNYVTKELK